MGADGEGRRAGLEGMAQGTYFGFVHGAEASPMDESGRGDPAFRVTGEESNPSAEISVSSKIIKNVLSVCSQNQVRENI